MKKIFFLILISAFLSSPAHAGGAAARVKGGGQQKAQAQARAQAEAKAYMEQQRQLMLQAQEQAARERRAAQTKAQPVRPEYPVAGVLASGPGQPSARFEEVKDIVDLQDLIASLNESSRAWELIISPEDKATVVGLFIDHFRRKGITIGHPPEAYVQIIDAMAAGDANMLNLPFEKVLEIVAVMEYDFGNGQDRDAMALKILGPQFYEKNRQRIQARAQQ